MNKPMLKRKYGDRREWLRVTRKKFAQCHLDEPGFRGYVTLVKVEEVTEPLFVEYGDKRLCIADDGYIWLQHFPEAKRYSVTTMFNEEGEIVQWYIDICSEIGSENGRPWMEDLFLDLIVLPAGEVILKDKSELEEAFSSGLINEELYASAINEAKSIKNKIVTNRFELLALAEGHKALLLKALS